MLSCCYLSPGEFPQGPTSLLSWISSNSILTFGAVFDQAQD